MQKLKKTFSLLITVMILLMTFTASAYAAEATQDGLKAQIIFEKENYGKNEEIPIKIIVKNTNNYDVQNVSIEGLIPDGLTLISDTATKSVDLLQSGETLELTYKIKLIDDITPSEPVTVVPTTEEPITNTTTTELPTENAATTETPNANVPTTIEPTTAYAENYQIGDVNNDKKITASDARLALRISAQLINATDLQIKAADTDNNGKISASDARKILRVSAKLDSFEDNSRTNNILTPLSSNLSDKKTGNISFMPLAVNSGKTISINNENSINTNINNIISLALGTCLSVIAVFMLIYFTRKDKNFKKRALSIMISVLIVLSSVSGISLFKAVASNEERKSFTISETVTVDGEEVTFYSAVWYLENNNIAEEDNENMISVEEIEKMELVLDTISNSMKNDDYIKIDSNNEKVEYINNMLSALSNQELIIKNSIQYSESGNCFAYKHINGVRSFIWLNTSNNLEVNLNNKSLSNEDKLLYINNDTKAYNSNREITDAVDTVFMYGFDNINEEYSYFEKYDLLMREYSKLGLLTNIYSNPTVFDYKTAFTDAEYINILEHGGFDPNLNISYFCVTGDKPDENTLLSYNTDIYFERILSGTNESGEKVFIITPKFFEFYYSNDKLDGAVVFLFCCKGFGTDGNVNYEFAKAFEKCGADTIIGFHNSVFEGYAFSIYKEFTDLMLFGYSTGDSLSDAKDLFGNNDVEYGKKFFPLSEYWQKVDPKINKTWKQSLEEHSNAAYPIIYGDENKKFDIITGKITGTVIDSKTNDPLSNITVKATIGDFVRTTLTDENGEFSIKLPVGEWEISVEATDTHYCNEKRTVTVEKNKDVTLSPPFYMKNGAEVSGTVKDKNTDTPIANATIEVFDNSNTLIMEGIDGTYNYEDFKLGELITTTTTDENGNYSISLPSGKYAIAVNHDNYNFNGILLTVEQGFDKYLSQNILLTPKSEDDRTVIASGECGTNANWELTDNGVLTIRGEGAMPDFSAGSAPWYEQRNEIKEVVIENGITSIGRYAFYNCTSLRNITIPDSVTSIGSYAFSNCTSLGNITIPDSVTTLGQGAFEYCGSITELKLSENLTELGSEAFSGCTSLNSIDLGNSLTEMGFSVFEKCDKLKSVALPASINNSSLASLSINYHFKGYVGALGRSYIESVILADGATTIPANVFCGAKNLKNAIIPNSVTSIGSSAFRDCTSLEDITIPDSVTSIDAYAFNNCTSLASITIPNSSCTIYDSESTIASNAVIYGYTGSTAQAYAEKYNRTFVALD